MEMDNFLQRMSTETGKTFTVPGSKRNQSPPPAPPATPPPRTESIKPKKQPPKPIPQLEDEEESNPMEDLNEETVEQIYEITSVIMKTIRKTFPDKKARRLAFQSIQEAINLFLTGNKAEYAPPVPSIQESFIPKLASKPSRPSIAPQKMAKQPEMISEDVWNNMPTVSYDAPSIGGLRMNPNLVGNEMASSMPSRVLSDQTKLSMSEQDIIDIKNLAGIGRNADSRPAPTLVSSGSIAPEYAGSD